jgi:uncharacterized protein YxeA
MKRILSLIIACVITTVGIIELASSDTAAKNQDQNQNNSNMTNTSSNTKKKKGKKKNTNTNANAIPNVNR